MPRQPQMPGEQPKIDPATGLPPVLQNTEDDPNKIARDRERITQATANLATGGEGEIAPSPDIDDGPAIRTAQVNGQDVRVRISPTRRDPLSAKYGPESRLAKGTQVNEDGSVFEGTGQPYGVIGDYLDPAKGWLINRIIPLASLEQDKQQAQAAPGS